MKKFFLIVLAGLAGVIAALMTLPKSSKLRNDQGTDLVSTQGEAGSAMIESPKVRVANRKALVKQMTDEVEKVEDGKWLRSWRLTERSGKEMGSEELKGTPYIASFFFATCPVVCVRQNDQVRLLQEKFKKLPIKLVSITCDPENDTPEKLAEYATRMTADPDRWLFFTGDWNYLQRISAEVFFNGLHQPKEHIEKFLLFSAEGKLIAEYDWHSPEEIKILEGDVRALFEKK